MGQEKTFISLFHDNGISMPIFLLARKMDLDLVKLFNDKIFNNYNEKSLDVVTKNLLGLYGNFIATNYFKALGYDTINEKVIIDENNKCITKADVSFLDKNGNLNLCEVKAVSQIIDNIRNYVDDEDNNKIGSFEDKDEEIIKYKNIGKKLIKQVEKLKKTNGKVNVVIFQNCIIDDVIIEKLKNLDVNIITIGVDVKELENQIRNMVLDIKEDYENIKQDNLFKQAFKSA